MKVLFDTMVYVADAIGGKQPTRLFAALARSRAKVYISEELLTELGRVLVSQLGRTTRLSQLYVSQMRERFTMVKAPASRHRVSSDANDSHILRAAHAAGVDFLVTNDRHLLDLHPYEGIEIVSMNDFESLLRVGGLFS